MESTASIIEEAVRPLRRRVEALEDTLRGVDLMDGHNLRRAQLAEQREAVAIGAARDHARTIDDLRRQLEIAQDVIADTSMERDMAEEGYDRLRDAAWEVVHDLERRRDRTITGTNSYLVGVRDGYCIAIDKLRAVLR